MRQGLSVALSQRPNAPRLPASEACPSKSFYGNYPAQAKVHPATHHARAAHQYQPQSQTLLLSFAQQQRRCIFIRRKTQRIDQPAVIRKIRIRQAIQNFITHAGIEQLQVGILEDYSQIRTLISLSVTTFALPLYFCKPANARNKVVLPTPFRPTTATI